MIVSQWNDVYKIIELLGDKRLNNTTQPAITCSKLTIEILEQSVKLQIQTRNYKLVFLLLTLNM